MSATTLTKRQRTISALGLRLFVEFVRLNKWITDDETLRRVFDAYRSCTREGS